MYQAELCHPGLRAADVTIMILQLSIEPRLDPIVLSSVGAGSGPLHEDNGEQ